MFSSVLIVCVGNICRSPMAEALLADRLKRRGLAVRVGSAGIGALVGRPADPISVTLMGERGIDLSGHRARQLTSELVRSHEVILVMEAGQQKAVLSMFPGARGRVHCLGRWGRFDVPDPYRQPRAAFERALELIERGVDDLMKAFWPEGPNKHLEPST